MSHIISDALVTTKLLTEEQFRQSLINEAPVGFGPFQQFVPGDYEYETALYRISMVSSSGDRGVINKLQVDVDVPDMMDRGRVTITPAMAAAGPTWVSFSRPFHIPPEPVTNLMSASFECVVRVLPDSVTRAGFMVYLQRTDNGERTDGVLTWAAHSY
ncbi:hypothetical protein PJWF_00027 [Achromobacter phage JWF]|uniref:hypothetical protein n=1 Tax=Achromobacter phage JWF TaxID=1589748 RepID=UPI000588E7BE|nr:hypothetical protein AXJ13_gp027 [Achromobacter phage JWF]AJD82921.1 hypothetical protein PJWF_00027 [Achromobacter phage JWF]